MYRVVTQKSASTIRLKPYKTQRMRLTSQTKKTDLKELKSNLDKAGIEVEQLYTPCLSIASYWIRSGNTAAAIDPLREVEPYRERLSKSDSSLKYILETHFHADFVSGHLELAREFGGEIVFGPGAEGELSFDATILKDGDVLPIGDATIKVLHTPGHTLESVSYLLQSSEGKDVALFTGDTLFIGDVGRPDLVAAKGYTKEVLASKLYDSLNNKIKPLADDVIIFPSHGPGSACGKNLGSETFSSLGIQKQTNPYLQDISREDFVKMLTADLPKPPNYFSFDVKVNKQGYKSTKEIMDSLTSMNVSQIEQAIKDGATIVDTRDDSEFLKGHIPGSISMPLSGRFAEWIGRIITSSEKVVLLTHDGNEEEAIVRLSRIGFENTMLGYLKGGIEAWTTAGKECSVIPVVDQKDIALKSKDVLIDVRAEKEYNETHLPNALNLPLAELRQKIKQLECDSQASVYVHCKSGLRALIGASIVKASGFENVYSVGPVVFE